MVDPTPSGGRQLLSERLGEPISDDTSEDETSQIRALEEDRGIYHHQEVVVPPQSESDEDIPIPIRPQAAPPQRKPSTDVDDDDDNDDDHFDVSQLRAASPQRSNTDSPSQPIQAPMERRRSVRFTGAFGDEDPPPGPHLRSPSPESLSYIRAPAHAHFPFSGRSWSKRASRNSPVPGRAARPVLLPFSADMDMNELAQALENPMRHMQEHEGERVDRQKEFEQILNETVGQQGYPSNSPPAYSGDDRPRVPKPQHIPPVDDKRRASKARGTLNELLLSKVALPFQNMMRRASRIEESSESEEDDETGHDFTEEEIQVLTYIDAFKPTDIDLRPQLKPFLLDFVPSIGDIDAFIKIPRPDEIDDNVGLTHLDEPATQQSDKTILNMQLRSVTKEVGANDDPPVKLLANADKNTEQIENWITSIKELHRSKPAQTVHYKGPMPDVELLMQEWPAKFEETMRHIKLPTAELDVPLEQFVDICLNIIDIPVSRSRIQSLHLLFSLYSEFSNSQHFRNIAHNNRVEREEQMDRLEL